MKVLKKKKFKKIMSEDSITKWEGDNAYQGLQILSKYTDNLITGAGHDIIYSEEVNILLDKGLTEEDARELKKLNWMIHGDDTYLACFV